MAKIPSSLLSVMTLLAHLFGVPFFYLGFVLMYDSKWITEFLQVGQIGIVFNTLMLTSILLVILCASRIPMTVHRKEIRMAWWQYIVLCMMEISVFSAFAGLYMSLTIGETSGYFPAFSTCLRISFAILPYPYLLLALFSAYIRPDKKEAAEEDLVRFADSTGRLKLVIAQDVILYIEAQENYVIWKARNRKNTRSVSRCAV